MTIRTPLTLLLFTAGCIPSFWIFTDPSKSDTLLSVYLVATLAACVAYGYQSLVGTGFDLDDVYHPISALPGYFFPFSIAVVAMVILFAIIRLLRRRTFEARRQWEEEFKRLEEEAPL